MAISFCRICGMASLMALFELIMSHFWFPLEIYWLELMVLWLSFNNFCRYIILEWILWRFWWGFNEKWLQKSIFWGIYFDLCDSWNFWIFNDFYCKSLLEWGQEKIRINTFKGVESPIDVIGKTIKRVFQGFWSLKSFYKSLIHCSRFFLKFLAPFKVYQHKKFIQNQTTSSI